MRRKNFQTDDGKSLFELSICVFMDVLGFAASQKNSFQNKSGLEEFQRFYSVIKSELDRMNELQNSFTTGGKPMWELKVFTDNMVLGYPLFTPDAESEIGHTITNVADYQLAMAREGYFVRGGLSVGNLFMDTYLAYGPALLEAYELENETARDPRIVVSPMVRKLLEKHFSYYAHPQEAPQNRDFLLDSDGQIFIHYLGECFDHPDYEDGSVDRETLGIHKQHIEKGIADFASNSRVWAKYAWLATYHNYSVQEWIEKGILDSGFRIDGKLHRSAPVKLCPFLVPERNIEELSQ